MSNNNSSKNKNNSSKKNYYKYNKNYSKSNGKKSHSKKSNGKNKLKKTIVDKKISVDNTKLPVISNISIKENKVKSQNKLKININKITDNLNNIKNEDLNKEVINLDKKSRVKKYLKESLLFSIIMIILDIIGYFIFEDVVLLHLFNVEYLNVIVTIILSFIILFMVSYIIDYLVGEFIVKKSHRHIK